MVNYAGIRAARFSLKDAFIAISLIAGGLTSMRLGSVIGQLLRDAPLCLYFWIIGSGLIGAGLGAPFQKKRRGAAFAVISQFVLFVILRIVAP